MGKGDQWLKGVLIKAGTERNGTEPIGAGARFILLYFYTFSTFTKVFFTWYVYPHLEQ